MFFDDLLDSKGYTECPLPLWRLKITDEEFEELRKLLNRQTHKKDLFLGFERECALFFAEYWRRLYCGGPHRIDRVYSTIESTRLVDLSTRFYESAKQGGDILGIEFYTGNRREHLNDLLYQGGLPMKLVTENISGSVWDRFTRGLVNRRIDFEDLDLGVIAESSQSIRQFCSQLISSIEFGQYQRMPFWCNGTSNSWFVYLTELAKEEKVRQKKLHPFTLSWEFRVDRLEHKIVCKYKVVGSQRLPKEFIEENNLIETNFFSVQIKANDLVIDTYDFVNNFCRYSVNSKHPYKIGDTISISIQNCQNTYLSDTLDLNTPHLLTLREDGKYEIGNRIDKRNAVLLIPSGWELRSSTSFYPINYTWDSTIIKAVEIPSSFEDDLIVDGPDGSIIFGANTSLLWTEIKSESLYIPNVKGQLYDASKCRFKICCKSINGYSEANSYNIEFRNKWENCWHKYPPYGEIYARAVDTNGQYVAPIKLANVGDGLYINVLSADDTTCLVKVTWAHGNVVSTEGIRKANDCWEFKKETCLDKRILHFTLAPRDNSRNLISLEVKAPFREFYISNLFNEKIENLSFIPYADVDKYQYHLVGQNIKKYVFGSVTRELKWIDDQLYIMQNGKRLRQIPYEGTLLSLFDSRELLRSMLDRTSQGMLEATVNVEFEVSPGQQIHLFIKECPFRPTQVNNEINRFIITGYNRTPIAYKGKIKLLKFSDPSHEAVEIDGQDTPPVYSLPESTMDWGNTLIIGRTKGRICPALIIPNTQMNSLCRKKIRETTIADFNKRLNGSMAYDNVWNMIVGWFDRVQKEYIPASSIIELKELSHNKKALLLFAFLLFSRCNDEDEQELLLEQLKAFSQDLAFQWYWLEPFSHNIGQQLDPFIDPSHLEMQKLYIKWAMKKDKECATYLSALSNPCDYHRCFIAFIVDIIKQFEKWIKQLFISSMTEGYGDPSNDYKSALSLSILNKENFINVENIDTQLIDISQPYLTNHTLSFFNNFKIIGKPRNEKWFHQRAYAVVSHLNKDKDLFSESEEIRRSVIFYCKSKNELFLCLINKLKNQQQDEI